MLRLQFTLAALLATAAFAGPIKINKADRKAVQETVEAKDGEGVPPELSTPRIDTRIEKLRLLIVQGIKDKQLSAGEQTSAINELHRIEREEQTYKHNKRVGPRERNDLKRDLNKLHEHLYEKTHNGTKPTAPLEQ